MEQQDHLHYPRNKANPYKYNCSSSLYNTSVFLFKSVPRSVPDSVRRYGGGSFF